MPLAAGARLGAYEIVSLIGAGGMGEVYRARDPRLDRTVAIKVLPSTDAELRARFEREAKTIASLQHPHICTLFDIGHDSGTDYLVLEFLQGETLAARLERGCVKLNEAIPLAIQIADALDKAHRAGIVHRDLKPANIMLTAGGAKLLDFGLAKLQAPNAAISGLSIAATMTTPPNTAHGTILGTLHYMSPEQLEGRDVDARSDIWAFGGVLYEMLSGRKAFDGASTATVIAAIIERQPEPLSNLQPLATPFLEHLVMRCLAKDPDRRWQAISDVKAELHWLSTASFPAPFEVPPPGRTRRWAPWIVTAAAIAVAAAFASGRGTSPEPAQSPVRIVVEPPRGYFWSFLSSEPAVSPDGQAVALVVRQPGGRRAIAIRSFDVLEARILRDTEDARLPFWSADGKEIAFFLAGKLKAFNTHDGVVREICDVPGGPRGGTWNDRGDIVLATGGANRPPGLFRVAAAGGVVQRLSIPVETSPAAGPRFPSFLPDGDRFLFHQRGATHLASMNQAEAQRLVDSDGQSFYVDPGFLVFTIKGALMAAPFDEKRSLLSAGRIIEDALLATRDAQLTLAASRRGTLLYAIGGFETRPNRLVWFDRTGRELGDLGVGPGVYVNPVLSPDGEKVAYGRFERAGNADVWIRDLKRGISSRLTFGPRNDFLPTWSPDSTRIVYSGNRGQNQGGQLLEKSASGTGDVRVLAEGNEFASDWSPDGQTLIVSLRGDLWTLPAAGGSASPLLATAASETLGRLSHDGRFIAYQSDESGRSEIYVRTFPDATKGTWQISTQGGSEPVWRRAGKELFFISDERKIMAVEVGEGPSFGTPSPLFAADFSAGSFNYTVTRDGQRFLINVQDARDNDALLVAVLNWSSTLKQ